MNPDLDDLARLAWTQLWQVTAVALLIGAVVRLGCRTRPRVTYALWMLVVVKAIVPPFWSSPTGLFSWALVDSASARSVVAGETRGMVKDRAVTAPLDGGMTRSATNRDGRTVRDRARDWSRFDFAVFSIWTTGLVLCAATVLGKQIKSSRLIRRSSLLVDERFLAALANVAQRLNVRRRVRLIVTWRPIGPAVFGLLKPSILLPDPLLSGMPPEQVELVLAHELIHVRRSDVFASQLQLVAQLVWWFHPVVWWVNREAGRERERCCDQEVVSGVGCKRGFYARTLLSILEQKGRLRSLLALPGVRALEVTSLRLESIMRYTETDQRRASRLSRFAFAVGVALFIPGTGLSLQVDDKADGQGEPAPENPAAVTLRGVVREKGTGRPVAGIQVYAKAVGQKVPRDPVVTDENGRYAITDLPKSREYKVYAYPIRGAPYLITSRIATTDNAVREGPFTADLEVTRGIPFRVLVLDGETGQPLKGKLVYYPVSPNNPFERGVMGSVGAAKKGETVCGAFYEARPDDRVQFHGAVLSGPGSVIPTARVIRSTPTGSHPCSIQMANRTSS
jgi:beta-lactamase regulating signal transducer with metallopeptidase domain